MRTFILGVLVVSLALAGDARADEPPPCKPAPATTKVTAMFAPGTSLRELVTWISSITCKIVLIDQAVDGRRSRVTIVAPRPMTPKAAMQLFVDALEAAGLTVVTKKDTITVKLGPGMKPEVLTDEVTKRVLAGITKVDDTHYEITWKAFETLALNSRALGTGARIVPAVADGKPAGFKLYAIRPSSVFAHVGLTNGDTILKINDVQLAGAALADAVVALSGAKVFTIEIERRGKPVTLVITIKN